MVGGSRDGIVYVLGLAGLCARGDSRFFSMIGFRARLRLVEMVVMIVVMMAEVSPGGRSPSSCWSPHDWAMRCDDGLCGAVGHRTMLACECHAMQAFLGDGQHVDDSRSLRRAM